MKFVALVSGGKDSCFNILHCLAQGHELVALANLYPPTEGQDELDSYMYQTVGHDILTLYSQCIGKPMYRQVINGKPQNQNLEYKVTLKDETEDLYKLLKNVLDNHPDIEGVSVGAILSSYQRTRVEDVCSRLGLTSLAFLWQRDQAQLMNEMCNSSMDAKIVKVAAIGLDQSHLGMSLQEIHPTLISLNNQFGVHICGEGGEFETSVLDAPFFANGKIKIVDREIVKHTNDSVWYLKLKVEFESDPKPAISDWKQFIEIPPLLNDKFQDIKEFINTSVETDTNKNNNQINRMETPTWTPSVYNGPNKLFISNLYSNQGSDDIEVQTISIFTMLQTHLNEFGLSFTNIQSCKLLLSNMADFSKVNSIYTKYFNDPLPPSRICVETNLPNDIQIQLSVVVIKNLRSKSGLHVQGRSYWAPSNIGPYSQCISFEEDLIARLSGQIPLIPASMEIGGDFKTNALLALQHYDNVKQVTGYTNNLLTICFIKSSSYSPLAQQVFNEYMDIEGGNRQFIIVQVTELPKSADIEWGGLAFKQDTSLNYESDDEGQLEPEPTSVERVKVNFVNDLTEFSFKKNTFYTVYGTQLASDVSIGVEFEFVPVVGIWDLGGSNWGYAVISQ